VTAATIEKRKWDGSVAASWPARLWQEDGRILWWSPPGTVRAHPRRGERERLTRHERAASCGAGWIVTAVLTGDGDLVRYEVDATVGDERVRDGVFAFVDLDLDLEIRDGSEEVQDLIQFAERGRAMGYPPGTLTWALGALEDARERHRTRAWPFDGSLLTPPPGEG
jgi:hypothetical protein